MYFAKCEEQPTKNKSTLNATTQRKVNIFISHTEVTWANTKLITCWFMMMIIQSGINKKM